MLFDDLGDLTVCEMTAHREKSLVGGIWLLKSGYVRFGDVAYVYPEIYASWSNLILPFALRSPENALIGGVKVLKTIKRVYLCCPLVAWPPSDIECVTHDWTEDKWWVYGGNCKVGFLLFKKVPSCFLGKRFACSISKRGALLCLFQCDGIPILFRIYVTRPITFTTFYEGGKGRGDYDALNRGRTLLDGF